MSEPGQRNVLVSGDVALVLWFASRNLLAWGLFAVGLIAPLTPSEGLPSLRDLSLFAALPVALLAWCTLDKRAAGLRVLFAVQLVLLGGPLSLLLWHLWRTS